MIKKTRLCPLPNIGTNWFTVSSDVAELPASSENSADTDHIRLARDAIIDALVDGAMRTYGSCRCFSEVGARNTLQQYH